MVLPTAVEREVKQRLGNRKPVLALRSLASLGGGLGESYIVSDGERVWLYSRPAGTEFDCHEFSLGDFSDVRSREDAPYLFLELELPDGILELQFSTFDSDELARLRRLWQKAGGGRQSAAPAPATATDGEPGTGPRVTPMLGFCAALQALANADTALAAEEQGNLARLIDDAALLAAGHELWQQLGTHALIGLLDDLLTPRQKLCLMANLIDLAMVDGTLRGIEKETIRWFREGLGVDEDNCQALFDAMLLKNNIGIFEMDGAD
jgi:uncharacterized tellurite resistance protein B-like protein